MEGLLGGIPGIVVYRDDILVVGETEAEHMAALGEVLKWLGGGVTIASRQVQLYGSISDIPRVPY